MIKTKQTKDNLSSLYSKYVDTLYSYGCKFTSDKELIKDCIHDLFVKLNEKKEELSIRDFKFYLLRAFKNILLNELTKKHESICIEDIPFSYAFVASSEDEWMDKDKSSRIKVYVEKSLEHLTVRQKEVVYLYYMEELDYEEISKLLDISYQTARNTVHEALVRLRERLGNIRPPYLVVIIVL